MLTKGSCSKGISKPSARAHKVQDDYGSWSKPMRSSSCQPIGETWPRANPSTHCFSKDYFETAALRA